MYITKYSCVFLKLGESIYVAMDLIPILLVSLPLAHNTQHSLVFCTAYYCLVQYVRKKTRFQSSKDNKKRQNSDFHVRVPLAITTAQCFLALGVRALMTRTSGLFRGFVGGLYKLADSSTPASVPGLPLTCAF